MIDWLILVGGGVLLFLGAEWFVSGASALALALRIPQILVGLTVVAYGTSAPEVIVGIEAARSGHSDVALGNVLGSNIANIGLILGVAVLVRPARVDGTLRRREVPVLLLSTLILPGLLFDGRVSTWEALALLSIALGYTTWMIRTARQATVVAQARDEAIAVEDAAGAAGAPASRTALRSGLIALVGLSVLLLGGSLFVRGAVAVAHSFGMSERLVGLTIVAIGTSLPELATSVIAARRGHADLAVGNVIGSNIFNVLLCLSSAALAGTVGASLASLRFDLAALFVMTVVAAIFFRTQRTMTRTEAGIVLVMYAIFVTVTALRG